MTFLANLAQNFIGMFQKGGENFMGLVVGILPTLIVLMTAVNALIRLIGEDRVTDFAKKSTGNIVLRYTLLPLIGVFFLTNPMCYTFGRFVKEEYKPAFYDAAVSFVHPITGLFPHANSAELFVYMGIANGVTSLNLPISELAVRYFLVGLLVILIRGILTEKVTLYMLKKKQQTVLAKSIYSN